MVAFHIGGTATSGDFCKRQLHLRRSWRCNLPVPRYQTILVSSDSSQDKIASLKFRLAHTFAWERGADPGPGGLRNHAGVHDNVVSGVDNFYLEPSLVNHHASVSRPESRRLGKPSGIWASTQANLDQWFQAVVSPGLVPSGEISSRPSGRTLDAVVR